MLGGIREFIREYIRDLRLCHMSDEELDEIQREADEANTCVIPGPPGEPGFRLVSVYSELGARDTDFGSKEDLWGPPFDDEKADGADGEKADGEKGAEISEPEGEGEKNDRQV